MKYGITLFLYIGFMVGFCAAEVGEVSQASTYTWELPFTMLSVLSCPAVLGYLLGRDISRTCGTKSD